MNKTQLLQGTLDLLVLRILELGPNHGWGISNRLQQISKDGLKTSQGSLYPALHRLEMRGEVKSEMTASANNRRARVYTITRAAKRWRSPQLIHRDRRAAASLLFVVGVTDPATLGLVAALLTAVTLLACYVPARSATRVDPLNALRLE